MYRVVDHELEMNMKYSMKKEEGRTLMKISKRIGKNTIIFFIAMWIITNISYNMNNIAVEGVVPNFRDIRITFNFAMLLNREHRIALFIVILTAVSLLLESFTYNLINIGERRKLSKFDRTSYRELLTKFKRRRGTSLVKYDDEGNPTEFGIIKAWYRFKSIFANYQRKIANYYLWPETKKWNVVKYDTEGREKKEAGVPVMAMKKWASLESLIRYGICQEIFIPYLWDQQDVVKQCLMFYLW